MPDISAMLSGGVILDEGSGQPHCAPSIQRACDFLCCDLRVRNDAAHLQKTVHHAVGADVAGRNPRAL
jgi:hypothetical protein